MRWLLLLPLAACTPEMLVADDPIAASWLDDGAEDDIAERAAFQTYGEARLTPDGEPFVGAPFEEVFFADAVAVVEPADSALRVRWEDRFVRMLVWVEREDFVPVVHEGARAAAAPGRRMEGSGVWLKPGHVVEEPLAGWGKATFSDPILQGEVWVAENDVDAYWVEPPLPDEDAPVEIAPDPDAYLRGAGAILDAPDGEVLARTGDFDSFWIGVTRLDERDGWVEVEIEAADVRVVGWVPAEDVADEPNGGMGWSSCLGGIGRMGYGWVGTWDIVDAGTELHGDDGALVGVVLEDVRVQLTEDDEGRIGFDHQTPWGTARLWL